jgi:hypothetical protein
MKSTILLPVALLSATCAYGQNRPENRISIAGPNTGILLKITSSMSSTSSKPGDAVTAEVIDPVVLRGAEIDGTISRADHDILNFAFNKLRFGGTTYNIQSKLLSVTSSKGNEGQDDLGQRIRIEGAAGTGLIAYGINTALNEGAELRLVVWEK